MYHNSINAIILLRFIQLRVWLCQKVEKMLFNKKEKVSLTVQKFITMLDGLFLSKIDNVAEFDEIEKVITGSMFGGKTISDKTGKFTLSSLIRNYVGPLNARRRYVVSIHDLEEDVYYEYNAYFKGTMVRSVKHRIDERKSGISNDAPIVIKKGLAPYFLVGGIVIVIILAVYALIANNDVSTEVINGQQTGGESEIEQSFADNENINNDISDMSRYEHTGNYDNDYSYGYEDGYQDGYKDGADSGQTGGLSNDNYALADDHFFDGWDLSSIDYDGYQDGYNEGYTTGFNDGIGYDHYSIGDWSAIQTF